MGHEHGSADRPWRVAFTFSHVNDKGLIYGNDTRHNRQDVIGVRNRAYRYAASVGYTFSPRLYAEASFPYVINERVEEINDNFYIGRGLGDLSLRGKHYVLDPCADGWNPYAELGIVFPTGDGSMQFFNRRTRRREYMKPYITPGTGTWNPLFGVGIEKAIGDLHLSFNARGVWTLGENDAGYDAGNPITGTLGASYVAHRFSEKPDAAYLGASLALNAQWVNGPEERDGVPVLNTGGVWLRLEPGLFFSPDGGNFTMELSTPFPVYTNVQQLQTIERYGVVFTVGYRF